MRNCRICAAVRESEAVMSEDREFWGLDWEDEEKVKTALRAWFKRIAGNDSMFEYYDCESYGRELKKMSFSEAREIFEKDFRVLRFYKNNAPGSSGRYLFGRRYETAKQEMLKRGRRETENLIREHEKKFQEDSEMRSEPGLMQSFKRPGQVKLRFINPKIS